VRLILRPRPRPHEPLAPVGQPPQRPRPLVRRPHLLQQPGGEQPRERAGIEAVRLCLRLGDRLSLRVLATTTRIPWRSSTETIRSALVVASSATTSLGSKLCANSSSVGTRVAIRPAELTPPSSTTATSQKSRCTSNPNQRMRASLPDDVSGGRGGAHDKDGSVLSAHRVKSQGRPRTTSSSQLISQIGLPVRVLPSTPLSRKHHAPAGVGRQFHAPTTAAPTSRPSTRSPAARSDSATSAPGRAGRRQTGKQSASSAHYRTTGPTAPSTPQAKNAHAHLTAGSRTTTIDADTQPSATNPRSAEPTCLGPTANGRLNRIAVVLRLIRSRDFHAARLETKGPRSVHSASIRRKRNGIGEGRGHADCGRRRTGGGCWLSGRPTWSFRRSETTGASEPENALRGS
jgi:hypothetical protein